MKDLENTCNLIGCNNSVKGGGFCCSMHSAMYNGGMELTETGEYIPVKGAVIDAESMAKPVQNLTNVEVNEEVVISNSEALRLVKNRIKEMPMESQFVVKAEGISLECNLTVDNVFDFDINDLVIKLNEVINSARNYNIVKIDDFLVTDTTKEADETPRKVAFDVPTGTGKMEHVRELPQLKTVGFIDLEEVRYSKRQKELRESISEKCKDSSRQANSEKTPAEQNAEAMRIRQEEIDRQEILSEQIESNKENTIVAKTVDKTKKTKYGSFVVALRTKQLGQMKFQLIQGTLLAKKMTSKATEIESRVRVKVKKEGLNVVSTEAFYFEDNSTGLELVRKMKIDSKGVSIANASNIFHQSEYKKLKELLGSNPVSLKIKL